VVFGLVLFGNSLQSTKETVALLFNTSREEKDVRFFPITPFAEGQRPKAIGYNRKLSATLSTCLRCLPGAGSLLNPLLTGKEGLEGRAEQSFPIK
jgi:hypothetical protein